MERVYKTLSHTGTSNIVMGILLIVLGSLAGSFLIVGGARLLARKNDIVF